MGKEQDSGSNADPFVSDSFRTNPYEKSNPPLQRNLAVPKELFAGSALAATRQATPTVATDINRVWGEAVVKNASIHEIFKDWDMV